MPKPSVSSAHFRFPWELSVALVLACINYIVWIWGHDICTLDSETAKHLLKAYEASYLWQNGDWGSAVNTRLYPPLFYMPAVALFALCGVRSESLALLSLLSFIMLSAVGVYGLARHIKLPRWECASAAYMCATYFALHLPIAGYIIEYAEAPFVILALWTLLASDLLYKRRLGLLFATCCGLGLLAKWMFILYLVMGLPLVLAAIFWQPEKRRNRAINLGLVLASIAIIALPWYNAHHYHGPNNEDDGSNFQATVGYMQRVVGDIASSQQAPVQANCPTPPRECRGDWQRTSWDRTWPVLIIRNFGELLRYIASCSPPHLTILLVLGIFTLGWQTWHSPLFRWEGLCILLCLLFPLLMFGLFPSLQEFDPGYAAMRYASALAPTALVLCVFIIPKLSRGRHILLIALNIITLVYSLGWYFPDNVRLYNSRWFLPIVYGSDHLEFADPCGWFTAPKLNALEQVAKRMEDYIEQGYQPAFVVSLPNHFQPLFAHLCRLNHDFPLAAYERGRWRYLSSFSQHPVEPDADWRQRPIIYLYQDHLLRETSPEHPDRGFADNCHIDQSNLDLVHRLLQQNQLNDTQAFVVPRHSCREVYYFSTCSPQGI